MGWERGRARLLAGAREELGQSMDAMRVKLDDVLVTGSFGAIHIGSTPEDVVREMGAPEDVATLKKAPADVWKYGNVQFHCTKSSVEMIVIYFASALLEPWKTLSFEGWTPAGDVSRADVESHLLALGVPFHEDASVRSTWQTTLVVGSSGVGAIFDEGHLQKIAVVGPVFRRAPQSGKPLRR